MAAFISNSSAPRGCLFSGDVESVSIPGTEGDMGIFAGHAPVLSTLRPGVVTVDRGQGNPERSSCAAASRK